MSNRVAYVYNTMPDGYDDFTLAPNEFCGNDQVTIQKAIDYVHEDGGGEVLLMDGEYFVRSCGLTEAIRIYDNIWLHGSSSKHNSSKTKSVSITCITPEETTDPTMLIRIFGTDGANNTSSKISDIKLIGSAAINYGIYGQDCLNISIDNVDIIDCDMGIQITHSVGISLSGISIHDASKGITLNNDADVMMNEIYAGSAEVSSKYIIDISASSRINMRSIYNNVGIPTINISDCLYTMCDDVNSFLNISSSTMVDIRNTNNGMLEYNIDITGTELLQIHDCMLGGKLRIMGSPNAVLSNVSINNDSYQDDLVSLYECNNSTLNKVDVTTTTGTGIKLVRSHNSTLNNCQCNCRYKGIFLDSCTECIISGAYADTDDIDIYLETCTHCMVYRSRYSTIQYSGEGNKADQALNNQVKE